MVKVAGHIVLHCTGGKLTLEFHLRSAVSLDHLGYAVCIIAS